MQGYNFDTGNITMTDIGSPTLVEIPLRGFDKCVFSVFCQAIAAGRAYVDVGLGAFATGLTILSTPSMGAGDGVKFDISGVNNGVFLNFLNTGGGALMTVRYRVIARG